MPAPPTPGRPVGSTVRTSAMSAVVVAVALFDGLVIGAPVALLGAVFSPGTVFVVACTAVAFLAVACGRWVDRQWDEWFSSHTSRIESRLEAMRASRLMRHPVAWIQRGSDRWYALASALANPVLMVALARSIGGTPVGRRRIVLGS